MCFVGALSIIDLSPVLIFGILVTLFEGVLALWPMKVARLESLVVMLRGTLVVLFVVALVVTVVTVAVVMILVRVVLTVHMIASAATIFAVVVMLRVIV